MRSLYNPFEMIKNIFNPPKPKVVRVPSPDTAASQEAKAAEEAARKARLAAMGSGRRSTLLTGGAGAGTPQTQRRTLLGA